MVRIFSWGERWNVPINEAKPSWLEHSIFQQMKIFLPLHEWKHSLFVLYDNKTDHWHEVRSMLLNDLFLKFHRSNGRITFIYCCELCAITFWMIENKEIYRAINGKNYCTVPLHGSIARLHCTIMKMEISILYHVIVKSQSNRDNLTRCYIIQIDWDVS